ncbi:MAG TPA: uracil-DNA glycosylase [Chloroflexi bacterium]|nr:uracil-DNA glycosylase [Chloroflexota bacterium]HCU98572.1 uracil-DNA glycosylase [Chloroflexota bacterium]|tara:strand:- start:62 stop:682 length:621 start_codon:yes stop_codon:yes gene_type:complete
MRIDKKQLEIIEQQIQSCTLCVLASTRKTAVPGFGNMNADIMLIGEGPGYHEDEQGLPFVGRSGKLLDDLLYSIDLSRDDVYITNVVKCRPPDNRDPKSDEIESCRTYLDKQINLIDPKVIVTLGRFSMARWFPGVRISDVHGEAKRFGSRIIVPMFHPAAALYNPQNRPLLLKDFGRLPKYIDSLNLEQQGDQESKSTVEQLNLL